MSLRSVHPTEREAAARGEPVRGDSAVDFAGVVERMLAGDRAAHLRVARLVTGLLAHWGAYDFRGEWPDLVQDVLLAVIRAVREGRVEKPEALVGYVRSITHHKLMDRLRIHVRHREDAGTPIDGRDPGGLAEPLRADATQDLVVAVRRALEQLPERERRVVLAVYGEGKTYEEVVAETGIPLGSLKRYLRVGMAALRRDFAVGGA